MSRTLVTIWRVVVVVVLVLGSSSLAAVRTDLQASAAPPDHPVSSEVTAVRDHLDSGADNVVLSEHVTLNVAQTAGLRDRQGVDVSWSGAHPTQGIIADSNSGNATQQEYPMVLLQCRGSSDTITPSTCWAPTASERYQGDFTNPFPVWRVDRYATPTDRGAHPNQPSPRPSKCGSVPQAEHWMPFAAADGTSYPGGPNDCGGLPPDASGLDATLGLPSNATYAATGLDGTGSTQFNVRDASDNASLGCSDKVACAIVAIPIVGISCDVTAAAQDAANQPAPGDQADKASALCHRSGAFQPGELVANPQNREDLAVSGALWWSASNWRNRIVVPISFAPPANVCDLSKSQDPTLVYGSELMIQATTSWQPHFCLSSSLSPFKHVQTGEPQARNLLGVKSIQAAMVSEPPGDAYSVPTVHAPISVSGFAITFTIDNQNRDAVQTLRLTPRLLAKLMTESYPALTIVKSDYGALSSNPLDMSLDPEFIALNPGIPQGVPAGISASTLFSISSDSDVIHALTAYLNADPEARQWLDGKPDPWGMTVNPNYKGIALPAFNWPLLDTFQPARYYQPDVNQCLHDAPVPFLPLVASPTSRLANVALAMQFAIANSQTVCSQPLQGTSDGEKLVALGRQAKGFRFMVGLTSLADAQRFGLSTASLETQSSVSPDAKITDASGRTFVAPSDASLKAAADTLAPDPQTRSWPLDPASLRTNHADAYPGTMVVYADVPTSGLTKTDAKALSELLTYAAAGGQTPGSQAGQLPPGYLPMTATNGLGGLITYTRAAATDVAAQNGIVPTLAGVNQPPSAPPPATSSGSALPAVAGGGAPGGSAPPAAGGAGAPSATVKNPPTSAPTGRSTAPAALVGRTTGERTSATTVLLILLLVLVLLGPLAAPITLYSVRRRAMR